MDIKAAVVREKSGPFVMEDIQLDVRQESLSRRVRYWSHPGVCRDRSELHGDGGKQGYQSAGSHRDGPTEAELSASGRRVGRGKNRGGSFHQENCVGGKRDSDGIVSDASLDDCKVSSEAVAEMDQSQRGYLHPAPRSGDAKMGAGLFMTPLA